MKRIHSYFICFLLVWLWFSAPAQNKLSAYEYWFNNNYTERNIISIVPSAEHQFSESVDVSTLPDGVNVLHIRCRDEQGLFGSTLTRLFFKNPFLLSGNGKLVNYEFWFNDDYESKQVVSMTASDEYLLTSSIDVSLLPGGVNVFNFRTKDENGVFSSTFSKLFLNNPKSLASGDQLIAYEYWFNDEYPSRQVVAISPSDRQQLTAGLQASILPDGVNVLNIRYKDENNRYSSTLSKMFVKSESALVNNKIAAYRYWFNDDFERTTETVLDQAVAQFNLFDDLDLTSLPMGKHGLHFQIQDTAGKWSVVSTDSITKIAIPEADFYTDSHLCANSAIQFVNESRDADTWLWDFGDGTSSIEFEPEHTFTEAGAFTISLTVTDSESGKQNTNTLPIMISQDYVQEKSMELCSNELPHIFGSQSITTSGVYTETFSSENGCDSTVTLTLTVNPTYNIGPAGTDYMLVDDHFEEDVLNTLPDGWTIRYNGTGTADQKVVNTPVKNGNQSFQVSGSGWAANLSKQVADIPENVTLEGWMQAENVPSGGRLGFGIGNPSIGSWGAFLARVEFYEGNLITYHYSGNSGGYGTQYILQEAESNTWYHVKIVCDRNASTYQVYINGQRSTGTAGEQMYSEFPLLTGVTPTSVELYGNSMIYFDDVKFYKSGTPPVTICASETPYIFGEQQLFESGIYTETFQTIHGCDSVVTLQLTVNPIYHELKEIRICEGESYDFNDETFSETGEYLQALTSIHGCDSLTTLILTVNPIHHQTINASICEGSSYEYNGQTYSDAGEYQHSFSSAFGCDSLVSLSLAVNPKYEKTESVVICASELPYDFGIQSLESAGEYTETFESVNGCDSVVTLNLTVNPTYNHTEEATICEGERYEFGGQNYNETGEYEHIFSAVNGCDSLVSLSLTVKTSDLSTLPLIDPIANLFLLEEAAPITIQLSGIADGLECETHALNLALTDFDDTLIGSYSLDYISGEATGSLTLNLVPDAYGESDLSLVLTNEITGQQTNRSFKLEVSPVNDPPQVVAAIADIEKTTKDTLMTMISSEKGVVFDDRDPDDQLQITITLANGNALPSWLAYRNDSLMALTPPPSTGCFDLKAKATDLAGEVASIDFSICISFPTGTNILDNVATILVYPNPTSGKVYLKASNVSDDEADVSVFDISGRKVLQIHKKLTENMEIDLSGQMSGTYFLRIDSEGHRKTFKLIVKH